jgi:hypothetical protein
VPHERIASRYGRTMKLLPRAMEQCDRTILFDNSYRYELDGPVKLVPFCEIVRLENMFEIRLETDLRVPSWFPPG